MCMFCRSLFVLLYIFFSSLFCLFFFDIRILLTLLSLSSANFIRILTVLVDRGILGSQCCFEYGTGCEWHPSNQTLQCHVVTIRCYPSSAGSWQVFHIVGLRVFSHQSADYRIVVAHLTSNSFEGHPCCMHADYLPFLCSCDMRLRTMLTENA